MVIHFQNVKNESVWEREKVMKIEENQKSVSFKVILWYGGSQELIQEYSEEGSLGHNCCDGVLNFVWNQVCIFWKNKKECIG